VTRVDGETARELGEALPDHPFTFAARCLLLRNAATAWVRGSPPRFEGLVVQPPWLPTEPMAFGSSPDAIWELLRGIPGWDCVNVPAELAPALQGTIERELGVPTRIHGDVYFLLEREAIRHSHPAVRRLNEDDAQLVDSAPPQLRTVGFSSTVAALSGGVAAGGIVEGRLVSIVSMSASSEQFAEIGAHTLEAWRNQGMGTAAAYLVGDAVRSRGFVPVWSTGEDNQRSQRVARKVGFQEFGRKAYVIVPSLQSSGGFKPERSSPE